MTPSEIRLAKEVKLFVAQGDLEKGSLSGYDVGTVDFVWIDENRHSPNAGGARS